MSEKVSPAPIPQERILYKKEDPYIEIAEIRSTIGKEYRLSWIVYRKLRRPKGNVEKPGLVGKDLAYSEEHYIVNYDLGRLILNAVVDLPSKHARILIEEYGYKIMDKEILYLVRKFKVRDLRICEEGTSVIGHEIFIGKKLPNFQVKMLDEMKHISGDELKKAKYYLEIMVEPAEAERLIPRLKENGIKYDLQGNRLRVYLDGKISCTRLRKALGKHLRYEPEMFPVTVEIPEMKVRYVMLLPVLTKMGLPDEIWIAKSKPLLMRYGNIYIGVVPVVD